MIYVTKNRTLKRQQLCKLWEASNDYHRVVTLIAAGNSNPQLLAVKKSVAQLMAAIEAALETR